MRYYSKELINKHKDEIAFICGAGPSLYDIYTSHLFYKIFNHVVIAVNSSIMIMPWESESYCGVNLNYDKYYWISNDSLCRRWSWWEMVKKSKCIKIVRESWKKYNSELSNFLYFSPRSTSEDLIDSKEEKLAYCSSVPSALDLAIQMGCKKVFLLGVDHKEVHGYHHFWQLLEPNKRPIAKPSAQGPFSQQKKVFDINKKAFKALHNLAKDRGVSIFNCETWVKSEIDEFNKIYWERVFDGWEY